MIGSSEKFILFIQKEFLQDNKMMDTNLYLTTILMVIGSYFIMSNIMSTNLDRIYNHLNKVYMALLMGALMIFIHFITKSPRNWLGIVLSFIIMVILVILIRQQTFINDTQFLKGMIEHHDMAILMSSQIAKNTTNSDISTLANNIVTAQQKEISEMQQLL